MPSGSGGKLPFSTADTPAFRIGALIRLCARYCEVHCHCPLCRERRDQLLLRRITARLCNRGLKAAAAQHHGQAFRGLRAMELSMLRTIGSTIVDRLDERPRRLTRVVADINERYDSSSSNMDAERTCRRQRGGRIFRNWRSSRGLGRLRLATSWRVGRCMMGCGRYSRRLRGLHCSSLYRGASRRCLAVLLTLPAAHCHPSAMRLMPCKFLRGRSITTSI